ncbi:sce7726 family protein [Photobacterium sp. WH77]|uniref:sce7726 family protein n=1 Tax=unclassified Photobacterium TaxID=2628852 RepID=UPI001EDBE7C6|nr:MULTISPECIES: sce7726 family protein [unclassified Photobacterium]MCG2835322.1 sce7726 family protein [Photobacterium sp. WH77]MCG2842935.1 sce7726 family protein [Photobacterium sp. WH80]
MRVKDAARIFSSGHLTRLASGDLSLINRVATDLLKIDSQNTPIRDIFEKAYLELSKHYRHEYYYKNTIANKRLLGRHSLDTATMLSEFRVGRNIADCVIINGHSTCYEIKTEFDTLVRLEEQLHSYCLLFDKVYVVSDEKYLSDVISMAPCHVGVIQLTKRNTLSTIRDAKDLSSNPISTELVMNSLRAPEYIELTKRVSGHIPDVSNIHMFSACKNVVESVKPELIRDQYRIVLKKSRKNNATLIKSLPKSLINAGVSYKLPMKLQNRLISILQNDGDKELLCTTQYSGENNLS